jgi:hypothetical protein
MRIFLLFVSLATACAPAASHTPPAPAPAMATAAPAFAGDAGPSTTTTEGLSGGAEAVGMRLVRIDAGAPAVSAKPL